MSVITEQVYVEALIPTGAIPPVIKARTESIALEALIPTGAIPSTISVRTESIVAEVLTPYIPRPANDDFANAADFGMIAGTMVMAPRGATLEPGEGVPPGALGSIWHKWTAPSDGTLHIVTTGSDMSVSVGVSLGILNPGVWYSEGMSSGSSAGDTYYIQVSGGADFVGAAPEETYSLVLTFTPALPPPPPEGPANDNFADAEVLGSGYTGTVYGSNVNATWEVGEPAAYRGGAQGSIWYRWTPSVTGQVQFNTIGTGFDTVLDVFTGPALGSLALVVGDDDAGGSLTSLVEFTAQAGVTYHVRVKGYGSSDTGTITLSRLSLGGPPPPPPPEAGWTVGSIAMTSLIG